MTASVNYNRPLSSGNWATSLIWGRNRSIPGREVLNGYVAESTLRFQRRNYLWGRLENVDRTNELLLDDHPQPQAFKEHFLARVQAYTAGYSRDFYILPHLAIAPGGQITLYGAPASLRPIYGSHPLGVILFVRLRPSGRSG